MEQEVKLTNMNRRDKLKRKMIIFGIAGLILLVLGIVSSNMVVRVTGFDAIWLAITWISFPGFVLCSIMFIISFRRFRESSIPKKIVVVEAKQKLPRHRNTLILLIFLDIFAIVMIGLSNPNTDIICSSMACIIPVAIFFLMLVITGSLTIIKIVRIRDARKISKLDVSSTIGEN